MRQQSSTVQQLTVVTNSSQIRSHCSCFSSETRALKTPQSFVHVRPGTWPLESVKAALLAFFQPAQHHRPQAVWLSRLLAPVGCTLPLPDSTGMTCNPLRGLRAGRGNAYLPRRSELLSPPALGFSLSPSFPMGLEMAGGYW